MEIQNIQSKLKSKSRSILPSKGPIKASYASPEENWKNKYQFRSSRSVQGPKNVKQRNQDTSSDYGTMSRTDKSEERLVDAIPALNLNETQGEGSFNDISIDERKKRIESILDEITSIPRLVEANISQRNLKGSSVVSGLLASDRGGFASSRMSSRQDSVRTKFGGPDCREKASNKSGTMQQKMRRSISTPKLDHISERVTLPDVKESKRNAQKNVSASRKSTVPKLNLDLNSTIQSSQSVTKKLGVSRSEDDISSEFLPTKDGAMKSLVPDFGNETQNELAICAPTLGDDTADINESDTFDLADSVEDPINFIKANMNISTSKKGNQSRSSSSASSLVPAHRTGSVPKYLKNRQAQWAEEAAKAKAAIPDPDCPAGHVRLSDAEKLRKLGELTAKQEELLQEMNKLPVSSDTRRVVLKRREIEDLLVWVDEEIRRFSRPKVFVPEY